MIKTVTEGALLNGYRLRFRLVTRPKGGEATTRGKTSVAFAALCTEAAALAVRHHLVG
jgi:hypothetical protein